MTNNSWDKGTIICIFLSWLLTILFVINVVLFFFRRVYTGVFSGCFFESNKRLLDIFLFNFLEWFFSKYSIWLFIIWIFFSSVNFIEFDFFIIFDVLNVKIFPDIFLALISWFLLNVDFDLLNVFIFLLDLFWFFSSFSILILILLILFIIFSSVICSLTYCFGSKFFSGLLSIIASFLEPKSSSFLFSQLSHRVPIFN